MNKHYFGFTQEAFEAKKKLKLAQYPSNPLDLMVSIKNPLALDVAEKEAIFENIRLANMCLFNVSDKTSFDKTSLLALTNQIGLQNIDGNLCSDTNHISEIQDEGKGVKAGYIPYSKKGLTWHTDGYYNVEAKQIKGMVLYCKREAYIGGDSLLYDHERLFFELYEENPEYIDVLMDKNVLTIPANNTTPGHFRAAQTGPVFTVNKVNGAIHMRYSARTRNIEWGSEAIKSKGSTLETALMKIQTLLSKNNPYIYKLKMKAGEGVICNNVLHNRTAFEDNENKRLLYRARYYNYLG